MDGIEFKTELQLQAELVKWFSLQYGKNRGQLFCVNNDIRNNSMAVGMVPGVSDLVLVVKDKILFIELKLENSRQDRQHVINQLEWGLIVNRIGHYYIISSSIDYLQSVIVLAMDGRISLLHWGDNIESLDYLKNLKTKTFKYIERNFRHV